MSKKVAEVVTKSYVCDVCGGEKEVRRWRIVRSSDGKTVSPDLCLEHSELIDLLFDKLPKGRRGQVRARRVYESPEDVKKTVAKRTPPKK